MLEIPAEQLWLVACLWLSYPLSYWFLSKWPLQPSSATAGTSDLTLKHGTVGLIGALMIYLVYGLNGVWHTAFTVIYSYLAMQLLLPNQTRADRKQASSTQSFIRYSLINSALVLAHLAYCHGQRLLANDQDAVDVTGTIMIVTIKLTTLAWDICDGAATDTQSSTQTPYQRKHAVPTKDRPSLLALFGYVFFFPGILTGPAIPFVSYMRLIRGQYDSTGVQAKDAQPYRVSAQLTWRPALFRFFEGLAHAVSYLALSVYFPVSYLLSREFQEYSWSFSALFYRLIVIYITMQGFKAKLYLAWAWAEGSLIMMGARWKLVDNAGAKHKSADGQVSLPTKDLLFDYGDVDNFSYRGLELASSFQAIIRNWNISTHHWLKYYVYVRVIEVYKAGSLVVDAKVPSSIISLATLSTFVMSAFWHGFYSGYYLTFVTGAWFTVVDRKLRSKLSPFINQSPNDLLSTLINLIAIIMSQAALSYHVSPFMTLGLWESWSVWRSVYFCGHWFSLVLFLIANIL